MRAFTLYALIGITAAIKIAQDADTDADTDNETQDADILTPEQQMEAEKAYAAADAALQAEQAVHDFFNYYDTDGDGEITNEEYEKIISHMTAELERNGYIKDEEEESWFSIDQWYTSESVNFFQFA